MIVTQKSENKIITYETKTDGLDNKGGSMSFYWYFGHALMPYSLDPKKERTQAGGSNINGSSFCSHRLLLRFIISNLSPVIHSWKYPLIHEKQDSFMLLLLVCNSLCFLHKRRSNSLFYRTRVKE
jgi:hypothetical protein